MDRDLDSSLAGALAPGGGGADGCGSGGDVSTAGGGSVCLAGGFGVSMGCGGVKIEIINASGGVTLTGGVSGTVQWWYRVVPAKEAGGGGVSLAALPRSLIT